MVKFCAVGAESELQDQCRTIIEEVSPDGWEFLSSAPEAALPEADVYLWDFHPETFPAELSPQVADRSLFIVEPRLLDQLRVAMGDLRASIVLKPVQAVTLQPFIEHSIRRQEMRADGRGAPSQNLSHDTNELFDLLLGSNLKLQEYDQSRTHFLARAVHDFRAPLTALGGYCGLLIDQRTGPVSDNQINVLRRMQHSVQRLSRLTEAMFDLSAGRRAKRELNMEEADIEASLSQALHEVEQSAQEKGIQIEASAEPAEQPFLFDPGKIEQALVNLLENACKFTPKGGSIDVSGYPVPWREDCRRDRAKDPSLAEEPALRGASNAYRIDIRDSGCGISNEHLESIFEEYTSYAGGKDRAGGGLGLAICRMIVDAHQGIIWAESGQPGTQFSLILPYRREGTDGLAGCKNKMTRTMKVNGLSA